MKRSDLTEKILDIKREKEWSWSYIAGEIGGFSEILIVSALLGQMKLAKPQAAAAGKLIPDRETREARKLAHDTHGRALSATSPCWSEAGGATSALRGSTRPLVRCVR